MYKLKFNNIWSNDLGVSVIKRPNIPFPVRKINTITIPGRDGDLIEDEDAYKDITITVPCNFIDRLTFVEKVTAIKKWLLNIVDNKLVFSDNAEYFYNVKYLNIEEMQREVRVIGKFEPKFICDPFLYSYDGQKTITSDSGITLINDGYKSLPYIKIYGAGNITLTINGKSITLSAVTEYVEIDSMLMNCYKGTLNCNNLMTGDFPIFHTGENIISGTYTSIDIIPRWRQL